MAAGEKPGGNTDGDKPVGKFLRALGISPERAAGMGDVPDEPEQTSDEERAATDTPEPYEKGGDDR